MICQICGKNKANVHLKSIVNGRIKELYICSECASNPEKMNRNINNNYINAGGDTMRFFESKFSDSAETVVRMSASIASQFGHDYVGTEHLLYAILVNEKLSVTEVLNENGISAKDVYSKIDEILGIADSGCNVIGYTPRFKRIIEISFMEAKRCGKNYISPEHIIMRYFVTEIQLHSEL